MTASVLKAILCFIDAKKTPKIAFDKDEYAKPLRNKIKSSLGNKDGSQKVCISFSDDEDELQRQFSGVCENISTVFALIKKCS